MGLNVIAPVYHAGHKDFSTAFNFGDHLGVGWHGSHGDDWALRIQHYSNAGIRTPNPGVNYLQLRYQRDF